MKLVIHEASAGSVRYGDELIRYTVRARSKRASKGKVAIHVETDGSVIVDAPAGATGIAVREAVRARVRWIYRHQKEIRQRLSHVLPREYVSGETHLYLGRRYRLKIFAAMGVSFVKLRGGYIEVHVRQRNSATVRKALCSWYVERARAFFNERLAILTPQLRWLRTAPSLRLQRMTRQWGSCSPSGRITLNPALIKAQRECIDYVLLHELCHSREHNHSKKFYRLLDGQMPGWPRVKARLDDMAEPVLNA